MKCFVHRSSIVSNILSVQLPVFQMVMCYLWNQSFKGLTVTYTCIHPTESVICPHFPSIHSNTEINANFSYGLSGWSGQFMHDSHRFFGSPKSDFSYCKSHSPSYDNISNCTCFRAKSHLGFLLLSDTDKWCCGRVAWGLMLQLRTVMKRWLGILPSVSSITSMYICWAALLFRQVLFSSAFLYFILYR